MKNVNLTGLYLALMAKYGVQYFELSSIKKIGSTEPVDVMIHFNCKDTDLITLDDVNAILADNIKGEFKQAVAGVKDSQIQIYIEFLVYEFDNCD